MKNVMLSELSEMKAINETSVLHRLGRFLLGAVSVKKATMTALALLLGSVLTAHAEPGNDNRAPEVPDEIVVEVGNKVHFQALGIGVQIYTWDGTSWGTAVPEATLFHGQAVVATHFAGPTWVSNSGSRVVGALPPTAITVDRTAIPWLRLAAKSTEGPGIFADTTFIQRINTVGGNAPLEDGTFVGQVARVPYSADYIFYRHSTDKE